MTASCCRVGQGACAAPGPGEGDNRDLVWLHAHPDYKLHFSALEQSLSWGDSVFSPCKKGDQDANPTGGRLSALFSNPYSAGTQSLPALLIIPGMKLSQFPLIWRC